MICDSSKFLPNRLSNGIRGSRSKGRRRGILEARPIIPRMQNVFIVACLVFFAAGACRLPVPQGPAQPDPGPTRSHEDIPERCGECLEFPTGEVCTPAGTKRNSCLAICENVAILCNGPCPCPEEK